VAHLRELPQSRCRNCAARASVVLYNHVNAPLGTYCKQCGRSALRDQERNEKRNADLVNNRGGQS
jgi:hypothetical protein